MESNPAILFVGNFLSTAGFSSSAGEVLSDKMRAAGYRIPVTSRRVNRVARLADMLLSIWRWRHNYQAAHIEVFSGPAFIWAEWACRLLRWLGKPYVLALHGGNLPEFSRLHPKRVSRLLNSAAKVVAPSGYLKGKLSIFRDDIRYIPNGVDITSYPFRLRDKPRPKLVWLRAFHQIYNPHMAIDVIKRLSENFPDVRLKMIGPDKDGSLEDVRRLATELGVAKQVSFPGRIDKRDVPVFLNGGDIFINTTTIDNMPVSVIEALACGMCVVSTNVGGIPYLLENAADALLVPDGDANAMAEAVSRILTESELSARLSKNARSKVEHLDWSVVLPQWKYLFEEVAGRGCSGASR
jgi:glycosyltransferase involved in cell wall biosynthesis